MFARQAGEMEAAVEAAAKAASSEEDGASEAKVNHKDVSTQRLDRTSFDGNIWFPYDIQRIILWLLPSLPLSNQYNALKV